MRMSDSLTGKRVLVSGATGFIGKNLVKLLLELDSEVIAIVASDHDVVPENVCKVVYDGTYFSLENGLNGKKIDIIVHLATLFLSNHKADQISELIDSNIVFGTHLLEYSYQSKISFFINATTYAVSIDHIDYNPQNLYAATKKAFEDILKYYQETSETRFLTIELTDTYGPGDTRPKFINLAINAIKNNISFNMSPGKQEICYLFIDDAANAFIEGIRLLIQNKVGNGSKYSVFSSEVYTLSDLVDYLQIILGRKILVNKGFYPYRQREIMTFKPGFDCLPGWLSKYRLKDGVTRIIEYDSY